MTATSEATGTPGAWPRWLSGSITPRTGPPGGLRHRGCQESIIETADIAELKLGVTGSDPHLFVNGCGEPDDVPCDPGTLNRARQDLYGVVPLQHQGDANVFDNGGDPVTWTGIENPFGFTAGETVPIKLEHAAWYFGSKGVIPLNSLLIKNSSVLTDRWFRTFDRFGPGGTDAPAWGQLPNKRSS